MAHITPANSDGIRQAVRVIGEGGVVAFPTDTVYGLACDLCNEAALERVYAIKGRPVTMPLIAMFATAEQWVQVAISLPERARELMTRFWPGPLTLIVPARADLPAQALAGGSTIGMRIPDHPAALELLTQTGRPLATTSANRSGQPAACTAQEVAAQLGDTVDLILDGGLCPGGQASTVLDCTVDPPKILRPGPITAEMLGL